MKALLLTGTDDLDLSLHSIQGESDIDINGEAVAIWDTGFYRDGILLKDKDIKWLYKALKGFIYDSSRKNG
jgi:hypothetical protein